jgi:hypothetical protein
MSSAVYTAKHKLQRRHSPRSAASSSSSASLPSPSATLLALKEEHALEIEKNIENQSITVPVAMVMKKHFLKKQFFV